MLLIASYCFLLLRIASDCFGLLRIASLVRQLASRDKVMMMMMN